MPPALTPASGLASEILTLVGHDPTAPAPEDLFRRASRKQLLDCAQRLGLSGVSKLVKDELVSRIQSAFDGLRGPAPPLPIGGQPEPSRVDADGVSASSPFPPKFDLGPDAEIEPMPAHIPWGYGDDRVTAMAVDPDRLYVYWEITDDAVKAARIGLGTAGHGAWLNVRVYDISGRLFDGTNAHSYFDHPLERHDRQWFFAVNKPTSSACVEVGLRSEEGYFVKIARSGRVDFARREAAPGGPREWLTVRAGGATGAPAPSGDAPAAPGSFGHNGVRAPGEATGSAPVEDLPAAGWEDWTQVAGFPGPEGHRVFERRWSWQEGGGAEWSGELHKTEWIGPVLRTEWAAGPFTYPIEVPSTVEVRDFGEVSMRTEHGRVHIVYGPWQVVIRGLGARAERRVLGTWEYRRQVAIAGGAERSPAPGPGSPPGSSAWMTAGGSERSWLGASEVMGRGASELWLLGASEARFRGASEAHFAGASEHLLRGASELSFAGASERLLRGASELGFAGASERLLRGASETHFAGASERTHAGASERMGQGAAERPADPADGEAPSRYPALGRPDK
jgi:hypothetical protein